MPSLSFLLQITTKKKSLTDFIVPEPNLTVAGIVDPPAAWDADPDLQVWYLGIDFGTTGLSAVLLNRLTGELHPIGWSPHNDHEQNTIAPQRLGGLMFRLPVAAYFSPSQMAQPETVQAPTAVGAIALQLAWQAQTPAAAIPQDNGLLLQHFKSGLQLGLPIYTASSWEPKLQWAAQTPVPLVWLRQSLQALLTLFKATNLAITPSPLRALGLSREEFDAARQQLAGVILNGPAQWSDAYRFNLREAVLGSGLVAHPEQVFVVEDAIAALLSQLQGIGQVWQGGTLIVSAGATLTELVLVDLPNTLQQLSYDDFSLHSFPCAGDALDQDIVCQLLYPALRPQMPLRNHPDFSLEGLVLPLPGEPDWQQRQQLAQRLRSSQLGQSLLEVAKHLKLILQHQERFTLELEGYQWQLTRRHLESLVFIPFVQRLNRELNGLLAHRGLAAEAINQVICTGGTAALPAIARWLQQKLPNATIIQDRYSENQVGDAIAFSSASNLPTAHLSLAKASLSATDSMTPEATYSHEGSDCSRIAYGLAVLPLFPQVVDISRQQYSDAFLLLELLQAVMSHVTYPESGVFEAAIDNDFSLHAIFDLLEQRGINTHACKMRILTLLEEPLTWGLVPERGDRGLLTPASQQRIAAQGWGDRPLFTKVGIQVYRPDLEQCQQVLKYLTQMTQYSYQKLREPLFFSLVV